MSAEDFAKNIHAIVELKIGEESVSDPFVYVDKITVVGAVQALKEFAKQEAVDFFRWNAKKIASYMDYLRMVDYADGVSEKEIEANRFEGATIETRFEIYQQENLCNPSLKIYTK